MEPLLEYIQTRYSISMLTTDNGKKYYDNNWITIKETSPKKALLTAIRKLEDTQRQTTINENWKIVVETNIFALAIEKHKQCQIIAVPNYVNNEKAVLQMLNTVNFTKEKIQEFMIALKGEIF